MDIFYTQNKGMETLTIAEVRSFGDAGNHIMEFHLAALEERLRSSAATHTKDELCSLAIALMYNHRVPISTVREFVRSLAPGIFTMRLRNRRTILYSAISTRMAIMPDVLAMTPKRVLLTADASGFTPFHFACRHGSPLEIAAIGHLTHPDALGRLSRSGRSPLVEAILLRRGATIVDAIMPFVTDANIWQQTDRYGLCILHVAVGSGDTFAADRILDRLTSARDLMNEHTGRSIVCVAMESEMPLVHIVDLIGHLRRRCPDILADLMNTPSVQISDPIDLFHRTMHCRPVADALLAAIPPERMHETLCRRRGMCLSTIFHLVAEYPAAYVTLVGHGARCGVPIHDMLSSHGRVTGTPMHAVAEGSFANFNQIIAGISAHCDLPTVLAAMFQARAHDDLYAFECLRNVTDFDTFLATARGSCPEQLAVARHRQAIIRHAVRIGSVDVLTGRLFAQVDTTDVAAAAAEVHAYAARDDSLLFIATQSFSGWRGAICAIMHMLMAHIHPRLVTTKTERAILMACTHNIFNGSPNPNAIDRCHTRGSMHAFCKRVHAHRNWSRARRFVKLKWLICFWLEAAARPHYAPGGSAFTLNQTHAMALLH